MRIKFITSQHRRDFQAVYECEHCKAKEDGKGYDDAHFHVHVVPKMKCKACGEVAGPGYEARLPKYPSGMIV